jgi:fructose-specific PTS system IIC-like component
MEKINEKAAFAKKIQQHLMTATSYMIPFVVAGGVLFALSIMMNGQAAVPESGWLADLNKIGSAGLALFIPILGGYIAFSMADKPGLAPGMIGAYLAREIGAGFIGGIIAGFLAGWIVNQLKKIKVPQSYRTILTIFIIPLCGTLIVGGMMVWVIGIPVANFMSFLTNALSGMGGAQKLPLGLLLGSMVGVDMGGPINKVAYTFAQTQVDTLPFLMGGVGAAGAVPPIGIGLCTILFRKKFRPDQRDSGKAAILMGCMGITEGAIPFATEDPIRCISAYVIGCAAACASSFAFGTASHVPWGGLIALPVVDNRIGYFGAVMIGAFVVAGIIGLTKKEPSDAAEEETTEIEDLDIEFEVL